MTGIVKNVFGTSLLCQERSWNVAPLQPRLFVVRWPNNTALLEQKKVKCKTKLEHEFGFINGVDNVNWPPYRDSKS